MNHKTNLSLFVLIAVLLLSGCGSFQNAPIATVTPYPTPVRTTYTVERGDLLVESAFSGRVTPQTSQPLFFQMDGHVGSVYVQLNDTVEAGQLLAELTELKDLEVKWAEALDALQTLQTEQQRGLRRLEIDLEIAQLTLAQYQAEQRSEYEIQIQALRVELAQITLDEAKNALPAIAGGQDPAAIEAQMMQAQLFAPVSGQVLTVSPVGRAVRTTTSAFVIGDASQLEISLELTEEQLKLLSEGMAVSVVPETHPEITLSGSVRQLPYPYGTGPGEERLVRIALDQPPSADTYQNGDSVNVRIVLADKKDVLLLPPSAVRQAGGRTFVIVDSSGGPQRVEVQPGFQTSEWVEILSGLEEGQTVIAP